MGFLFYYQKIDVHYIEKIPKNKAVLFLSNHQNALLDPLIITVNSTRKNYFLTRADVFSNKFISSILNSLQMLPVYRVRDGIRTITKNKKIFSTCSEILHQNKSIILFPEGNHSLKRSVRDLSKGFTRIVEDFLNTNQNHELVIVPVGLNYQSPRAYGDRVSIYFGNHIDPLNFMNSENDVDIQQLKACVQYHLKELTTHFEMDDNYESTIEKLNALKVDYTNPKLIKECVNNQFKYKGKHVKRNSGWYNIFRFLTILIYSLPFFIWKIRVVPTIKEDEFIGTMRFATIISIAPIFLVLEILLIAILFGTIYGLIGLLIALIIPLITLRVK